MVSGCVHVIVFVGFCRLLCGHIDFICGLCRVSLCVLVCCWHNTGEVVQQGLALILPISILCPEAVFGWECISFHKTLAVLIRLWLLGRTDKL